LRLRSVVTSADQVSNVSVRGWDPKAKQAIVASAAASASSASNSTTPLALANTFGSSTLTSVEVPHGVQSEADQAASALADRLGGSYAELNGVARGNAQLAPGAAVSLSLAGDPFDGRYVLTEVRHLYDPHDGYTTGFTVSGRSQRSLLGLASGGAGQGAAASAAGSQRVPGVVVAIVTDVADPDNLGRIKVTYPWLDDSYTSDWAPLCQLGAGNKRGAVFLPEVGDEVVVAFDHGDMRYPVVLSSIYNGVDKPNLGGNLVDSTSGAVQRRGITSKDGHMLVFFDGQGDDGIALLSGDNSLRLSLNQSQTVIKITSGGSITIDGQSQVQINSSGDLDISATGTLSLKGAQVQISADSEVAVSGTPIKLN
jgi:uncharacterized protein involved in type VI secretion and phage assembly